MKIYWKLYKLFMRWRIRKEIGEEPKGTGQPVVWHRWKSLDEMFETEKEENTMIDGAELKERKTLRPESLYETAELMASGNYKDRFFAEYYQTKIRYEKLKAFNNRIEAANRTNGSCYIEWAAAKAEGKKKVEMPEHDCPDDMLRAQQQIMGEYLHILEVRAVIEGIDLDPEA